MNESQRIYEKYAAVVKCFHSNEAGARPPVQQVELTFTKPHSGYVFFQSYGAEKKQTPNFFKLINGREAIRENLFKNFLLKEINKLLQIIFKVTTFLKCSFFYFYAVSLKH